MVRAVLKGLLAHKLRLFLTAIAVVLGVAFVAGTFVLTDTINKTFNTLFAEISAGTDITVRSASGFGDDANLDISRNTIPASLLAAVRAVPGVEAADGTVSGYAQFIDEQGKAVSTTGAPTLGFNWTEPGLSPLTLRSGREPQRSGEVVVDAVTAREHDFALGDRIKILFRGPTEEFTVVGITGFGEADNLAGATLAIFEETTAQRVFGKVGRFDSIEAKAADGVSTVELRDRIVTVVPAGRGGRHQQAGGRRERQGGQPGARVPEHRPAGVRGHRPVRRRASSSSTPSRSSWPSARGSWRCSGPWAPAGAR